MEETSLSLDHEALLRPLLRKVGTVLSEYSFPSLYLFREQHNYHLIKAGSHYVIRGVNYDGTSYVMPLENLEHSSSEYRELLMTLASEGSVIFPIPEDWLPYFPEEFFVCSTLDNDADYLYLTEKIALYPGRKLHKKRNLVKQLTASYDVAIRPIVTEDKNILLALLEQWHSHTPKEMEVVDYAACQEAITERAPLGLSGVIVFADGTPAGFLLGEEISHDSYAIHFAKANIDYKGIYPYLFSTYAKELCPSYRYLNLEQDMGLPGLRKMKRSYLPEKIVTKYRLHHRSHSIKEEDID